jgi:hypothetical protein
MRRVSWRKIAIALIDPLVVVLAWQSAREPEQHKPKDVSSFERSSNSREHNGPLDEGFVSQIILEEGREILELRRRHPWRTKAATFCPVRRHAAPPLRPLDHRLYPPGLGRIR